VEHGRYGLQVHAALYRDLLTLIQRETLLASSALALELVCKGSQAGEGSRTGTSAHRWNFSPTCGCTKTSWRVRRPRIAAASPLRRRITLLWTAVPLCL